MFADRYGPWALVAGASDGVGAAFAAELARRGVNLVLVARRETVLADVAERIRAETGVETRTLAIDLALDDATVQIAAATADVEVGFLVYCAGADPHYTPFLDSPLSAAEAMVQRNCLTPMRLCHHFAAPMVARGRAASWCSAPERDSSEPRTWWPTAHRRPSTWCSPRRCGPNCATPGWTSSA